MPTYMRRDRMVQKGSIPVALLNTAKTVTFAEAMPGDYDIYFRDAGGVTITSVSGKTVNGFTVNLVVSLASSFDWVAVEIMS